MADRDRNGAIRAEPSTETLTDHVALSTADLAGFILGLTPPMPGTPLAALDAGLDRSVFVLLPKSRPPDLEGPEVEVHLLGEGSQ